MFHMCEKAHLCSVVVKVYIFRALDLLKKLYY